VDGRQTITPDELEKIIKTCRSIKQVTGANN
jgi:hypothetical protein